MTRTAHRISRRSNVAPELSARLKPFRVSLVYPDTVEAQAIAESVAAQGLVVDCYMTGREFLLDPDVQSPGVVLVKSTILDLTLEEFIGMMTEFSTRPLVIACPNHADVPGAVNALGHGVSDVLMRADSADVVLAAITRAYRSWYQLDADDLETLADMFEKGYERLSAREIEVLELVVKGKSSRDVAMTLGVCIKTIEAHRRRIHDKMRPDDFGHLVRMWRAANQ